MLQREVPDHINLAAALIAKSDGKERTVILDMGGTDDPISEELVHQLDYVSPNETELETLLKLTKDMEDEGGDLALKKTNSESALFSNDVFQFVDIFYNLLQKYGGKAAKEENICDPIQKILQKFPTLKLLIK